MDGRSDGVSSVAVVVLAAFAFLPFAAEGRVDDFPAFAEASLRVQDASEVVAGDTPCSHAVAEFPSAVEGERSKKALIGEVTLVAVAFAASQQAAELD